MKLTHFLYSFLSKYFPSLYDKINVLRFYHSGMNSTYINGSSRTFKEEMEIAIESCYASPRTTRHMFACRLRTRLDVISAYLHYDIAPYEYFLFGFQKCSEKVRATYLSNKTMHQLVKAQCENSDFRIDLRDKYRFYTLCQPFFHRDVTRIASKDDYVSFCRFVEKHPQFIIKPNMSSCGRGVHQVNCPIESVRDVFEKYLASGEWICEELITQIPFMSSFNESSVNTIRMNSFRQKDDEIIFFYPYFRTGRKGCIVDNGGAGGIFVAVDALTGMILTDGMDEKANTYIVHPDSHVQFKGKQIPQWEDLLKLVADAHRTMPIYHKVLSWDLALTDSGWVVIEGNHGEYLSQGPLHRGLKQEFLNMLYG